MSKRSPKSSILVAFQTLLCGALQAFSGPEFQSSYVGALLGALRDLVRKEKKQLLFTARELIQFILARVADEDRPLSLSMLTERELKSLERSVTNALVVHKNGPLGLYTDLIVKKTDDGYLFGIDKEDQAIRLIRAIDASTRRRLGIKIPKPVKKAKARPRKAQAK